jgi:hypothetical protein
MGTTLQHPGLPQGIKLADSVTPAHQGNYRIAGSPSPSQMHRPGQKPLSSFAACNDLNGLVLPDSDFRICFSPVVYTENWTGGLAFESPW